MDGSLFVFTAEVRDATRAMLPVLSIGYWVVGL